MNGTESWVAGLVGQESDRFRRVTLTPDDIPHLAITEILRGLRVHAEARQALIRAERERGPDFLRLANALSALYPPGCREKRLLDAMLPAVPR